MKIGILLDVDSKLLIELEKTYPKLMISSDAVKKIDDKQMVTNG